MARVTAVLQRFNIGLEEAALSLGASPIRTFRRITLPLIMPGVYAGALYAFLISFSDVPLTPFLAAGKMTTLLVHVFSAMEVGFDRNLLASSSLVILLALGLLLAVQRLLGLNALLRSGGQS